MGSSCGGGSGTGAAARAVAFDFARACARGLTTLLGEHDDALHELPPELVFGHVLVVGMAEQPQVVERRATALGHGHEVVVLEPLARRATVARVAHERASPAVALLDDPAQLERHTAIGRVGCHGHLVWSRLRSPGGSPALGPLQERVGTALQHLDDIARRHGVREQLLDPDQLLVEPPADRAAQLVGLGGERGEAWAGGRQCRVHGRERRILNEFHPFRNG